MEEKLHLSQSDAALVLSKFTVHLVGDFKKGGPGEADQLPRRSGFVLKRGNRLVLITAAHELNDNPLYLILLHNQRPGFPYDPVKMTLHRLSDGLLLFENVAPKPGQELRADFAFTPLNLEAITKDIHTSGIAPDEVVTLFSGYAGVIEQPNASDTYAFISWIDQSFVPHLNALDFTTFAECGMKYIGDDDGGLHQFRVAGNHKGDAYKGCSGSPIINQYGKVVSLVKRGDQEAGIIYGYPFGPFLPVVDEILADQSPPK